MSRIITGDIYSSATSKLIQFALLYVKKLELGAKYIKWITGNYSIEVYYYQGS